MKGIFEIICYVGLVVILFLISLVFENTKNNALNQVVAEKQRSEDLLLNVLPDSIASRLKKGEQPIADYFEEASVVFIDIANFTKLSSGNSPDMVVEMLNDVFTIIDKICMKYGLEKIKTIGDCYMAVSGIPLKVHNNAEMAANFALEVMLKLKNYKTVNGKVLLFRVGLDSGPVVAGVIGERKFIYDLWGDTVNIASRMESTGVEDAIHCTDNFKKALERQTEIKYTYTDRGEIDVKGKGKMQTWLIN
jgi:class 3 adenylate cyclase